MPVSDAAPKLTLAEAVSGRLRKKLGDLLNERHEIQRQEKEIASRKTELNIAIAEIYIEHDLRSIDMGEFTATKVDGKSTHISKTRLLERGVDPDIIVYATEVKEYTTIMIKEKKEED